MPQKSKSREKASHTIATPVAPSQGNSRNIASATASEISTMLAAPAYPPPPRNPGPSDILSSRPTLPPLSHLQTQVPPQLPPSYFVPSNSLHSRHSPHETSTSHAPHPSQRPPFRLSTDPRGYSSIPLRSGSLEHPAAEADFTLAPQSRPQNPLKRSAEYVDQGSDRSVQMRSGFIVIS
jgi:hypothetical protein